MTQTLYAGRMNVRYRVSRDDAEVRRRLDDLLDSVLAEGLEPALTRAGVPADEEICIRFVRAPARLRLDAGPAAAVAEWSAAIADAVAAAVTAPRRDVVRYRTRRAALADLALGIAAKDYERCWAWRQLGLWRGADPTDDATAAAGLVRALVGEPEAVIALLAEIARAGTLPRLAAAIDAESWMALAHAALGASGLPSSVLDAVAAHDAVARVAAVDADAVALHERALAIVAKSRLGRAFAVALSGARNDRADALAAFAVLAWLEAEPGAPAATPFAVARELVAATAAALAAGTAAPPAFRENEGVAVADGGAPDAHADAYVDEENSDNAATRHTTRFGGLLFLLGVLDELGLPAALQTDGPLADRPLEWTLHRLALAVVPAQPDDPAALAFAGLAPGSPPPDGEPISDDERAALDEVAGVLAESVRARLERADAAPDELLDIVCRRHGEILFDPGWIELRLPADEISVELRRAGLDLDPGWLPWLGAVVRFAYV